VSDKWDQALDDLLEGRLAQAPGADRVPGAGGVPGADRGPGAGGVPGADRVPGADGVPGATQEPAEPTPVQVAVLLGPFHRPEWMAWALDQLGVPGRCLKAGRLSMAVLSDPDEAAWLEAAAELSDALVFSQVLAVRRGPSEDPAASDMQAFGFSVGHRVQTFPPGLLLASLDGPVEDVLLDPEGSEELLEQAVASWQNSWQPRPKHVGSWWRRAVNSPDKTGPSGPSGSAETGQ